MRQLVAYLSDQSMPLEVAHITRDHIEAFITHLPPEIRKPDTANNRVRGLQAFLKLLLD